MGYEETQKLAQVAEARRCKSTATSWGADGKHLYLYLSEGNVRCFYCNQKEGERVSDRILRCSDIIDEEMASRAKMIQEMVLDPNLTEMDDPALSIVTKKVTTICLSWGGPADYLEVTHDENGIEKVVYRYSDWFDTATREVDTDSPLWTYADYTIQAMAY